LHPDDNNFQPTATRTTPHFKMGRLFTAGSAVFLAIGGFLFGYDSGIISSTIVQPYFVAYMGTPTNSQVGGIVSTFPAGAILGALSIAYLADHFGRKKTVFIGSLISVFGCALQGGAANLSMLMAGRFFAGVAVGLLSAIVPMYCSEIATVSLQPPKNWKHVTLMPD
jgi:MFS family permease